MRATTSRSSAAPALVAATDEPARLAESGYPAPPAGPPPTGTWRVNLEFPGLQARPGGIAVDATGVYLTGPVFEIDDVQVRRWGVWKLDARTGTTLWAVLDQPPNGPMPEHIATAGNAVIVAGHESNYLPSRVLVFERRDARTGRRLWHRRFAPADVIGPGKHSLGGIEVRGTSLLYAATVESAHPRAIYGELSLDTGKDRWTGSVRGDRRGRDIAADDSGVYWIEDTAKGAFSLSKSDPSLREVLWTRDVSTAVRIDVSASGIVQWFTAIEKRSTTTGALVWTSPLGGSFFDVAVDPTGIYVTGMLAASGDDAYFALAKLDHATGKVEWLRRTAEARDGRPTLRITADREHIYLFGYEGNRWFVERRRKSDGAIGDVTMTVRTFDGPAPASLAK